LIEPGETNAKRDEQWEFWAGQVAAAHHCYASGSGSPAIKQLCLYPVEVPVLLGLG
jgi:hypothetical protein